MRKYDDFGVVSSASALWECCKKCFLGVKWKGSVQKWMINQISFVQKLASEFQSGKDIRKGFSHFVIYERGKQRMISAVKFPERVIQKSLCSNVLYPVYTRSLIYDNAASQNGKGTLFAMKRVTQKLRRYYRRHGADGYVLQIDFKGYFENIDHAALKTIYRHYFKDAKLLRLMDSLVDAFGVKGLGLGSEVSQMHAVKFPDGIDHLVTNGAHETAYVRYMDDCVVISSDKKRLERLLAKIEIAARKIGITLSPTKTKITRLSQGFCFLKSRYRIAENGKILRRPSPKSVTYERRRLKGQIKLFKKGILSRDAIRRSFESWKASMLYRNARKTVRKIKRFMEGQMQCQIKPITN